MENLKQKLSLVKEGFIDGSVMIPYMFFGRDKFNDFRRKQDNKLEKMTLKQQNTYESSACLGTLISACAGIVWVFGAPIARGVYELRKKIKKMRGGYE